MFLERLSSNGIDTSPYYVPNGKYNTAPPNSDVQMPNCTMYAFCRTYEETETTERYPVARSSGGFGNAKDWYKDSPLPKGSQIKTGAIACFDGKCGHVAIVERVIDDTHALISESQYDSDKSLRNYKYWQKRIVELQVGKATLSGVGKLQGFLYPPINDVRTERKSVPQVEVTEEYVNVRKEPNGELSCNGCYCPMGIYDVLDTKISDGFKWYRIDKDCWIREGSWLTYYPEDDLKEAIRQIYEICKRYM